MATVFHHGQGAVLLAALVLLLPGCASEPARSSRDFDTPAAATEAHAGVRIAAALIGTPYRYGGATPRGFDCSGLVYYAFRRAGIRVPRTTAAQLHHARSVPLRQLQAGDLLFFRVDRRPVSHVGIYAGRGRFIHAPSRGRHVSYAALDDPYWRPRLIAAGRYF